MSGGESTESLLVPAHGRIRHMFDDLEDDHISGVPDLGIYTQKIENEALRAFLGLSADQTGVRISRVLYASSAYGRLEVDDVLMVIDPSRAKHATAEILEQHGIPGDRSADLR